MLPRCQRLRFAWRRASLPQSFQTAPLSHTRQSDRQAIAPVACSAVGSLSCRSLSTRTELSRYLLSRAKILQLLTRTLVAYPELSSLENTSSALSRRFTPDCSMRERMFMFICSLVPPDEPVDIPEFLSGATHAAHAVYQRLYAISSNGGGEDDAVLSSMATEECLALWKTKLEEQKAALGLPPGEGLTLTRLDVRDARLVEMEYAYSMARPDQQAESQSVFHLNEAMRAKVRFSVTEFLRAGTGIDGEESAADLVVDTTFDWSFDSDVSRSTLVDWHIAESTPFVSKPRPGTESTDREHQDDA